MVIIADPGGEAKILPPVTLKPRVLKVWAGPLFGLGLLIVTALFVWIVVFSVHAPARAMLIVLWVSAPLSAIFLGLGALAAARAKPLALSRSGFVFDGEAVAWTQVRTVEENWSALPRGGHTFQGLLLTIDGGGADATHSVLLPPLYCKDRRSFRVLLTTYWGRNSINGPAAARSI
jgi:hypothetical protein